jgi:hypothetical protein
VLEVRCASATPVALAVAGPDDVPYVVIGTIDGAQQVRLRGDSRGLCASILAGDYLEAEGQKVHEQLFDARDIDVDH